MVVLIWSHIIYCELRLEASPVLPCWTSGTVNWHLAVVLMFYLYHPDPSFGNGVVWDVTLCTMIETHSYTMKMEATCPTSMLVNTRLHGATYQETVFFILTALRTTNLTHLPFVPAVLIHVTCPMAKHLHPTAFLQYSTTEDSCG